jgi:hypothetical protein
LASTVSSVGVSSNAATLNVGQSALLTATARDANGNIVLVWPGVWQWLPDGIVVGGGDTATLTPTKTGSVTVSATYAEPTPAVSGSLVVPVGVASVGSVTVTVGPPAAVAAGAQWTLDGDSGHNTGDLVNGVTVGSHTIGFTAATGYVTPASQTVTVALNKTSSADGVYVEQTGGASGTISRRTP